MEQFNIIYYLMQSIDFANECEVKHSVYAKESKFVFSMEYAAIIF